MGVYNHRGGMPKTATLTPKAPRLRSAPDFDRNLRSEEAQDWHGDVSEEKHLSARQTFPKPARIYTHAGDLGFAEERPRKRPSKHAHRNTLASTLRRGGGVGRARGREGERVTARIR